MKKKGEIFLIDPLSKAKIHVPGTTIDASSIDPQIAPMPQIFKAYMPSAPISNDEADNNDNCLILAFDEGEYNNIHLCRLGDKSWTRHHINGFKRRVTYNQMLFYNGSFLAIEEEYAFRLVILELVLEMDHDLKLKELKPIPYRYLASCMMLTGTRPVF